MNLIGQAITTGGAGLNFKVVGGTVAPANPKENTIWVNTPNRIAGWIFSNTDPLLNSVNLYNSNNVKNNFHLKIDGTETGYSSYSIATVSIPEGVIDVQITMGTASTSSAYHCFYDADGNFISSVLRKPGTNTYTVPNNAKTLRISVYKSSDVTPIVEATISSDAYENVVWFQTGTSSNTHFNALKKNNITVYPISCKQYVSGAWVSKTEKTYQGGAWVDWRVYFYNNGNECTNLTGGWELRDESSYFNTGALTKNANSMVASITNGRQIAAGVTKKAYDLTNVNTVVFVVDSVTMSGICAVIAEGAKVEANFGVASIEVTNPGVYSLDVSALTGNYQMGFGTWSENTARAIGVSEVYAV